MEFNYCVLDQTHRTSTPLLERVKFLAIASSNMDEFFEIRAAALVEQADSKIPVEPSLDGTSINDQVAYAYESARRFAQEHYQCWRNKVVPELEEAGIVFAPSPNSNWRNAAGCRPTWMSRCSRC